jgi:proton-translocating NADH-quinone oxidoreductase chain N
MENVVFWFIATPILAAPLVYLLGRSTFLLWQRRPASSRRPEDEPGVARLLGVVALVAAWFPFLRIIPLVLEAGVVQVRLGQIALRVDGISLLLAAVALGLGTLVALFSNPYVKGESDEEKYYAMLTALVGVMIGLGCAGDLFNLWVWFEAMAISSYLLVVFYREQPASLEAGVKYVLQSAVGSILALLGIALVLFQTGTLDLVEIHARIHSSGLTLAAGALFLIGFGVKAALVPLHTWLPDAHTQAPSGISAMLSGVVIEAGLIALLRALAALSGPNSYPAATWGGLLMAFGVLNMLVGNLMALRQTQVKRLLAYSSLSHIGYMVVGVGIAIYAREVAGAQGGLFHLLNHGIMKGLAFLAAGALLYAVSGLGESHPDGQAQHGPLLLTDLNGAAQRYPLVALAFSLAVLGLGGLPPLAGFMSKWQIFVAGFNTHNVAIGLLVGFAGLNSVLSLAYYAPLVNAVYRKQPSAAVLGGSSIPALMTLPLVILASAVVLLGFWPGLLEWLTGPAGAALMTAFGG